MKAINVAAYGASLVFLNDQHKTIAPLYNYLKPFPEDLLNKFYADYGGKNSFSIRTASPVLGNLNSGMQIYRLKYQRPEYLNALNAVLHLPQYLSYLLTEEYSSELTSIGCHTNLWDFEKNNYHEWVYKEEMIHLLPANKIVNEIAGTYQNIPVGVGIHDSSSALIPYLLSVKEPFILLSTGTWSISLNPFNHSSLTETELKNDCLCFLSYEGKAVKASRLFAGNEHEQQVRRLAVHFNKPVDYLNSVEYDPSFSDRLRKLSPGSYSSLNEGISVFGHRNLNDFVDYENSLPSIDD